MGTHTKIHSLSGPLLVIGASGFVGVNLLQSAFTGFCPLETMLRKLGAHDTKTA